MREHPTDPELLDLVIKEDFYLFGCFVGGLDIPQTMYIRSREWYGRNDIMDEMLRHSEKIVEETKPDAIAGCATAGTPIAMAMARHHRIPFLNVRKEAKEKGMLEVVEGHHEKGWNVLVVDDGMGDGRSKLRTIKHLENEGMTCSDVLTWVDVSMPLVPELIEKNVKIHSLMNLNTLNQEYADRGVIPQEITDLLHDTFKDSHLWNVEDKDGLERWHKYKKLVEAAGIEFIEKHPLPKLENVTT